MTTTPKALSVRQPWAHAIIHNGKDIENRKRHSGYRGTVLIHASIAMPDDEYRAAVDFMMNSAGLSFPETPARTDLKRGGIIGAVDMLDSIDAHDPRADSGWWMGPRGYVFHNPRPIRFIPCKGTVAPIFWDPAAEIMEQVRAAGI